MKKLVFWIQTIVLMIQAISVILLGFEVHGKMNTDNIIIEAYIIGICLLANVACTFYKLCIEKK